MTTPDLPPLPAYHFNLHRCEYRQIEPRHGDQPECYMIEDVEARERILMARIAELEADAERMVSLRNLLNGAVSASVLVNDAALSYETPEPGRAVQIIVYPETPGGSVDYFGDTLDAAIDAARNA